MKRKILSIFMCLAMVLTIMPMTVFADDAVSYIERSYKNDKVIETTKSVTDYIVVDENIKTFEDGKWYVVNRNVTNNNRIYTNGTANLILMDGKTINLPNGINVGGVVLEFKYGNTLNIFGQENNSGTVIAASKNNYHSAIGGDSYQRGSIINIHGGTVIAKSDWGAGIGGGDQGHGGIVTIYGGIVSAEAFEGAGIGGGQGGPDWTNGGILAIYGGKVTAKNKSVGSALLWGYNSYGGTITLGKSITFGAGSSADDITMTGNYCCANKAKEYKYFVSPYGNTNNYTPATCTEPSVCTVCGATEGKALGHDYSAQGALVSEATCTKPAVYEVKCSRCDSVSGTMEVGEALGHDYRVIEKIRPDLEWGSVLISFYSAKCMICGETSEISVDSNKANVGDKIFSDIKKDTFIRGNTEVKNDKSSKVSYFTDSDSLTKSVSSGEAWNPDRCYTCKFNLLGIYSFEEACVYTYPTCTTPSTCIFCGHIDGEALGHTYVFNSKGVAKCKRCSVAPTEMNYTYTSNIDSSMINVGDIIKAGVVIRPYENYFDGYMGTTVDGKYLGVYTPYKKYTVPQCLKCVSKSKVDNYGNFDIEFETVCLYTEATCTTPSTCVYCGHIDGEALGHNWQAATIYAPKTCSVCGETEGDPIGGWDKVIVTKSETDGELDMLSLINKSVIVLEAEYNKDGKMLQADYKNLDLVANEAYKYEVNLNKYSNGNNVKVFIWDNLNAIKPLSEFIEFKVN